MIFKAAQCPNCGGQLQVPTNRDTVICMYCGQTIEIERALQETSARDTSNLMTLAIAAKSAGNNNEAYDYFTRILEHEPGNHAAWIGKGEAAGWLSTLANSRLTEMVFDAQQAVKFAPEPKSEIAKQVADIMNRVAVAYGILAQNHLTEFIEQQTSWAEYLTRCSETLNVYAAAHSLDPTEPKYIKNIIAVCWDNMSGRSYRDRFDLDANGNPIAKAWFLAPAYNQTMQNQMNEYAAKMQQLDPTYQPPVVNVAKPAGCFVATATLGDPDHPIVERLRSFRDEILLGLPVGRKVVESYYGWSPGAAAVIYKNSFVRWICYVLVVVPGYLIACALMRVFPLRRSDHRLAANIPSCESVTVPVSR